MPTICTSTSFEPYRENDLDMSFDFDLFIENYCISHPIKFTQQHFTEFLIRHGLMLLWFRDLMNVTEKLHFIDPMFRHSCLMPSLEADLIVATSAPFKCTLISCSFFWRGVNRRQVVSRHRHDLNQRGPSWYARLPNKGAGGNVN